MASGPYYQSLQPDQPTPDELRISQGLLGADYGPLAPQASMYPDPGHQQIGNDYHSQPLIENEAEDHAQLQGLVEAATSAAAQEQIRQRAQQLPAFASTHADSHADQTEHDLATLLRDNSNATKRKRSLSHNSADPNGILPTAASERPKRQKRTTLSTPDGQDGDASMRQYNNPIESPHHLDARAAGVHSAAALFRPPSDSSKKYTRPPMSKLFSSLELSPENFLYLQAAAKQFMLDPDHPERQACVGNRGKGDSDMVKLKLHHCVREFLETGGWGEKYFGENAPPPGESDGPLEGYQRKFVWPQDRDRIIALCTPLLRRMVTNERQRQYAVESRKGGSKPDKANGTDNDQQEGGSNPNNQSAESSLSNPNYDPRLPQGTVYQVYLLSRETKQQLHERIDYNHAPHEDLTWDVLTSEVQRAFYETMQIDPPPPDLASSAFYDTFTIKVLGSSGLTGVSNEGEWQLACQDARLAVWLEGVVKVVVDCAVYGQS